MNTSRHIIRPTLLAAILVAASGAAVPSAHAAGDTVIRTRVSSSDGGDRIEYKSDGTRYTISLNGRAVREGNTSDEWKSFDVVNEDGDTVGVVVRESDGTVTVNIGEQEHDNWTAVGAKQREELAAQFARDRNAFGRAYAMAPRNPPKTMLGVGLDRPDTALATNLGVDPEKSTMISSISDGLPAAKGGLRVYDVITKVNGDTNAGEDAIRKLLREKNPGDTLEFEVVRGGERRTLTVTLEAYSPEKLGFATAWGAGPAQGMTWNFQSDEAIREKAKAMEELAKKMSEQAARAAQGNSADASKALADLNIQMETLAKELAERAQGLSTTAPGVMTLYGQNAQGGSTFVVPAAPAVPGVAVAPSPSPGGARNEALRERMDKLDERLARLEELLTRIAEQKPAASGGKGP